MINIHTQVVHTRYKGRAYEFCKKIVCEKLIFKYLNLFYLTVILMINTVLYDIWYDISLSYLIEKLDNGLEYSRWRRRRDHIREPRLSTPDQPRPALKISPFTTTDLSRDGLQGPHLLWSAQ